VKAKDYLTKLELAERLGVTKRVVEDMMRRRMIPYRGDGGRSRVEKGQVFVREEAVANW